MNTLLRLLSTVIVAITSFNAIGQNVTITGTVVNMAGKKIAGSVIAIDSTGQYAGGNIIEEGSIHLMVGSYGKYSLKISATGYKDLDTVISIFNIKYDLAALTLPDSNTTLGEVSITATKHIFERTSEGTRVNVENTLLARSTNAAELLTRTPGVTIAAGKANVLGRGEAVIMVNGRETTLESFKSLPPSEIKSLEIITNPGARYDAKGKAVIVVMMKKGYQQGISANVNESITMPMVRGRSLSDYLMNVINTTLNYRHNAFNMTAYYSNEAGTNWSENVFSTKINSSAGIYNTKSYYTENSLSTSIHYYRLGMGYDLNKNSSISAQYDGMYHFFNLGVQQNGDYYAPDNALTLIRMSNAATTKLINHSVNVNYMLKTDSLGSNLFIGAQYNRFQNTLLDHITERITSPAMETTASNRMNNGNNVIYLYSAQADYTKKLPKASIDAGLKYSYITNEGRIRFLSKPLAATDYTENTALANSTLYQETVPAAYLSYKQSFNKFSLVLGTRAEYTIVNGVSKKLNTTFIDSTYFNLFPNARLGYVINDNWNTALSYSRKINRPLYQDLDPFMWYLDSLTSIRGNSRLTPEYLDQIEGNISFKQYTLRAAYTISTNTIWAVSKPGSTGPNSIVYVKDNLQHRYTTTLAVDVPVEKKNYSSFTTLACNFYRFVDNRVEYKTAKASPQFYCYTYHQYVIPKACNLELTGEYYGASTDGFTQKRPYYYLTMGASRDLMKGNLNISLLFNDILRSTRWQGQRIIGTFTNDYNQRIGSHYLRLGVSYKFGALRNFRYANKAVNEKEFNRIKR